MRGGKAVTNQSTPQFSSHFENLLFTPLHQDTHPFSSLSCDYKRHGIVLIILALSLISSFSLDIEFFPRSHRIIVMLNGGKINERRAAAGRRRKTMRVTFSLDCTHCHSDHHKSTCQCRTIKDDLTCERARKQGKKREQKTFFVSSFTGKKTRERRGRELLPFSLMNPNFVRSTTKERH